MNHEILMPRLSDDVEEGILVTWFVEPGSIVQSGSLIAEVQVEKTSAEINAPVDGEILELRVEPGGVVAQGAVLAVLEESVSADAGAAPAVRTPQSQKDSTKAVMAAVPVTAPTAEPITRMRRVIAERLTAWQAETAQVTLTTDADVTELIEALGQAGTSSKRAPSLVAGVLKACALALRLHPRLAARWSEDGLVFADSLEIGVAIALEDGLIVPVVKAADTKDVVTLHEEIASMAERARTSKLESHEMVSGIFTVSNLGAYGIDAFTPLLNPPQTATLGMGRAKPVPAVVNGSVVVQTRMVLSLTFDHRVVDGVPAAAFLRDVVMHLQGPAKLGMK